MLVITVTFETQAEGGGRLLFCSSASRVLICLTGPQSSKTVTQNLTGYLQLSSTKNQVHMSKFGLKVEVES